VSFLTKIAIGRWLLKGENVPNSISAGALPQMPLGELTVLLKPLADGKEVYCPLPKNPTPL